MIKTDYPAELKQKVITAIKCSFISCRTDEERYVVECAIVEFLTAMDFTAAESIDVLKQSDGNDIETDDVIDRLIKSFEEEIE
ncbi:hypothetical protein RCT70_03295 [Escherichia marmotae]|nr:hypothetical protein [Escherichia marmotae]